MRHDAFACALSPSRNGITRISKTSEERITLVRPLFVLPHAILPPFLTLLRDTRRKGNEGTRALAPPFFASLCSAEEDLMREAANQVDQYDGNTRAAKILNRIAQVRRARCGSVRTCAVDERRAAAIGEQCSAAVGLWLHALDTCSVSLSCSGHVKGASVRNPRLRSTASGRGYTKSAALQTVCLVWSSSI